SPSNVLSSFEGEVKLCDFGIARANDAADLPAEDALQGKAGYMSPEHARGEPVDERADVFSAGILLWELLAGRKLYRAESFDGLLALARRAEIAPPPERRLPDEAVLHAIVMRALEPRRDDRYGSAAEMLGDLTRYAASANLMASPLRLGEWLREHFGGEILAGRRARERALRALDLGPPAVIEALALPIPVTPTPSPASMTMTMTMTAEAAEGEQTPPPVSGERLSPWVTTGEAARGTRAPSLLRRALSRLGVA
ncbi:MAG TPA: protein kinase, partial [Candidatus Nanopelagicales bacterium]|nr:protein kinase [Candidatus Nanopelagicales bacterium]